MELFEQKFTIHPVGQGLFYSGQIKTQLRGKFQEYNFVFDCGSMNKINCIDEIEEYHRVVFRENGVLDLLIISHFDQDHVNHIYKLLENRKVKKVIMPFAGFEERFLLVLKWIEQSGAAGTDPSSIFTLSLILDPAGAMLPFLDDEEGEIVFINSNPNGPAFTNDDSNDSDFLEDTEKAEFVLDFGKGITSMEETDFIELQTKSNEKLKKTVDSDRPVLKIGHLPIMEFLFYRKQISDDEKGFYDEVYQLFIEKFGLSRTSDIEDIVNVIKTIRTATKIKNIFKKARENSKVEVYKNTNIEDLNTTALCLLHRNKESFYKVLKGISNHEYFASDIVRVQKFEGLNAFSKNRVTISRHRLNYYDDWYNGSERYPNVLLTSDSFLLHEDDVDAFYDKYKNYWQNFWLFQIPHHGSDNNADITLLAKIPFNTKTFINYGVIKTWGGTWRHPSNQLVIDLTATGHSNNLIPINEFSGLEFKLTVYN